jgi:alpha-tubulin suppressor-like RCC1 family protein
MGANYNGQLGDGTANNNTNRPKQIVSSNVVAIAAGDGHSLFVKSDGSLWAMGYNGFGELGNGTFIQTNLPVKIVSDGVVAVSSENYHSLFLKTDGSLWGMGYDGFFQLGDGFFSNMPFPEQLYPPPPPTLKCSLASGTDMEFEATCQFAGAFYLLSSTNISLPLNQWMSTGTNSVTMRGDNNFSMTLINALNSEAGQRFYILQSQ